MGGLEGLLQALERIGWLLDRNVPVIGCRLGAKACWRVRGDYWLAGRWERRLLDSLYRRYFGVQPGFEERLAVLHRIPAPGGEYAVEVFAEAARLGVVEYVAGRGWLFHPSGAAASIAASLGARVCRVEGVRGRLKGKRVRLSSGSCKGGWEGWTIVASNGWIGPARPLGGGWFKVKDMAPEGMKLLDKASMEEAVEANAEVVGGLASEAREFIRRVYTSKQAGQGKLHVAFSGGADSAAVLSLAREAVGAERVTAVYVDTGMEFPETRRYVEKVASILGVDLEVVEAEVDVAAEIAKRGLMSRDNRWCTRLLKLEPLRRYYERKGVKLVLDGARRWESENRARTPRLGENPLIPGVARALPIHHWPRIAVQLYLYERNIPVNQLYQEGLTRIGCMICPAMHLHELHTGYKLHPTWYKEMARRIAELAKTSPAQMLAHILRGKWRKEGEESSPHSTT